jgi:hypothetical protein
LKVDQWAQKNAQLAKKQDITSEESFQTVQGNTFIEKKRL